MRRRTWMIAAAAVLACAAGTAFGQTGAVKPAPAVARRATVSPIWAPEAASAAPLVFIRQNFALSAEPVSASLRVTASCPVTVYVDGRTAGTVARASEKTLAVGELLHRGRHVLAFECARTGDSDNMTFALSIRMPDGRTLGVASNGDERVEWRRYEGWEELGFKDARWPLSRLVPASVPPAHVTHVVPHPATVVQVTPAGGSTATVTPAPGAGYDTSRLIREWSLQAGGRPGDNVYARQRSNGDRMILSANMPYSADFPVLASAGFTLFQTDSNHLSTEETAPGSFDYTRQDANLKDVQAHGLDWCYSPHFAVPPPWYSANVQYTRVQCLEHDRKIDAFSPWEPKLDAVISRGYAGLAERYGRPDGAVALDLGIYGDYGEAGMFYGARTTVAGQRDNWEKRFGDQHDHTGWWCGDALARDDFRDAMQRKYRDLDGINAAWKTDFRSRGEIVYPKPPPASSRRYWLDFVEWYQAAIGRLTDTVCTEARRGFPQSLLMVPAGYPDDDPRYGADTSLIASTAAKHGATVRSTHAGMLPFAENQASIFGRLASASRFYGAPLWTEPPGKLTADQETGRVFEALSQGATGMFDWSANVRANREIYYRLGRMMRVDTPIVDVAMYYPTTSHLLHPGIAYPQTFLKGCTDIRDVLNYDIVDERMVRDGALRRYRVLVMWEGAVSEKATLDRIREWVEGGGTLVAYDFGKIETVEGDPSWFRSVFGYAGRLRRVGTDERYVASKGAKSLAHYRIHVADRNATDYLSGDWFAPEETSASSGRWTGASARVRVPLIPGRGYVLTIRATAPSEASDYEGVVSVNGKRLGELSGTSSETTLPIPANYLGGRDVATVTISGKAPASSSQARGADDRRTGAFIEYMDMDATLAPAGSPDPGPPAGRFDTGVNLRRLKTEWAVRLGRGWTVYFPATRAQLRSYYDVVRYVTYHLSEIDPTKADAVAVDDEWDGAYTTLMRDRVLYYNPGAARVSRRLSLKASAADAEKGLRLSRATSFDVTVDPGAITAVPFTPAKAELLLQCEKFTELGRLKPLTGPSFSPGIGPTHVLIPKGGSITTRFECEASGRYNVFVRAVRGGATALASVLVDGRPVDEPLSEGPRRTSVSTRLVGSVSMTRGLHTLTLRPLRGQDARADYVVLAGDPMVAGYTFAVK